MAPIYHYQDAQGRDIYGDTPPNQNNGDRWPATPANRTNQDYARRFIIDQPPRESKAESDYKFAKEVIAAVRKYIPNAEKYIDALNYLRSHDEAAFQAALRELRQKNPRAWIELQKSPLFREKVPQGYNNLRAFVRTVSDGAQGKSIFPSVMDSVVEHVVTEAKKRGYVQEITAAVKQGVGASTAVVGVASIFFQIEMDLLRAENAELAGQNVLLDLLGRIKTPPPGWSGKLLMEDMPEHEEIRLLIYQGKYIDAREKMIEWVKENWKKDSWKEY